MTNMNLKAAALVFAAPVLALAAPAQAAPPAHAPAHGWYAAHHGADSYDHKRKRGHRHDRYDRYDRYDDYDYGRHDRRGDYYGEPVYRDTRIWRGRDGRYYCRKENGTTGLLIGAGVGAMIGHEVAGRGGDRTLGAIIGAAGGAILGRAIDRSSTRCR